MKKLGKVLLSVAMLLVTGFVLTSCGGSSIPEGKTRGEYLCDVFNENITTSNSVDTLTKVGKASGYACATPAEVVITKGYVLGFNKNTFAEGDYKSAYSIQPKNGSSIAFIAFVFEVESNQEEFANKCKENAQENFNVCVVADEVKTAVNGNYVFVVICNK